MKREAQRAVTGEPHPRLEGGEKVTGRAEYSSDVRLPGQLYARVLRSPLPHARISRIDMTRAQSLPGVHAVLSIANAPEIDWYENTRLFDRTLRFNGDEVAAVAAESEELAEEALLAIDVEYEPLPFAVTIDAGMRGEPVVEARGDAARGLREADVVIDALYTTQCALRNQTIAPASSPRFSG